MLLLSKVKFVVNCIESKFAGLRLSYLIYYLPMIAFYFSGPQRRKLTK